VEWDLAPFGLALHGDRAQGVGGMSAELVTSGGESRKTIQSKSSDLRGYAAEEAVAAALIVHGLLRYSDAFFLCRSMWCRKLSGVERRSRLAVGQL
jgi:hypothetical protein